MWTCSAGHASTRCTSGGWYSITCCSAWPDCIPVFLPMQLDYCNSTSAALPNSEYVRFSPLWAVLPTNHWNSLVYEVIQQTYFKCVLLTKELRSSRSSSSARPHRLALPQHTLRSCVLSVSTQLACHSLCSAACRDVLVPHCCTWTWE